MISKSILQSSTTDLLSPESAFVWPQQAVVEKNWPEAAQRGAAPRKVYPDQTATWFQGAKACCEAGEVQWPEVLLARTQQQFPNYPNNLLVSSPLALFRREWDSPEFFFPQARGNHPGNLRAWIKSAECAQKQGSSEPSATYPRQACLCTTDRPEPFYQPTEPAMRTKRWERTLKHWETLRKCFPDAPGGHLRAAEAALRLGRVQEARNITLNHQFAPDFLD